MEGLVCGWIQILKEDLQQDVTLLIMKSCLQLLNLFVWGLKYGVSIELDFLLLRINIYYIKQ